MKTHHTIVVRGKTHDYTLHSHDENGEKLYFVECPSAGISQDFCAEDMAEFLEDLPQWIREYEKEEAKKRKTQILFRVQSKEKAEIERRAKEAGYKTVSGYVRDRALA